MNKRKNIYLILAIGVLLFCLTAVFRQRTSSPGYQSASSKYSSQDKPVRIMVATDLHYLSSSLTDNGGFFTDMIDNADGKYMYYIEEITEAFVEQVIAEQPELLILSGDLTFNGEKQSHLELKEKLSRIEAEGIQILVIPGNHDIDRSSAAGFSGSDYYLVDSISKQEFADLYQDYGLQQSLQRDDDSLSYVYKAREDLWILMLDSNAVKVNSISDKTLLWLEKVLEEAEDKAIQLLAVSHQNILSHNPYFKEGFIIHQAEKLEELYQKYPVMANLSGHIHIQHIEETPFPEILTSALPVSPHHYGMLHVDGRTMDYQVQTLKVEEWAVRNNLEEETLLDFTRSSRQFMEDVAWKKADKDIVDNKLTEEERATLLTSFAKLNADYFAGERIERADYSQELDLWQGQGSRFYRNYIDTILAAGQQNHHQLIIYRDGELSD